MTCRLHTFIPLRKDRALIALAALTLTASALALAADPTATSAPATPPPAPPAAPQVTTPTQPPAPANTGGGFTRGAGGRRGRNGGGRTGGSALSGSTVPFVPGEASADYTPFPLPTEFEILGQINMFSKTRRIVSGRNVAATSTAPATTTAAAPPPKPSWPVVVGLGGTDSHAVVLESPGGISVYKIGDTIPGQYGGVVTKIDLDFFDLLSTDTAIPRRINLGQDLTGQDVIATGATSDSSTSTTTGAASGGTNDILERMKQRRLQQTGSNP